MNLVTIEHLSKSYTERLLFDDASFSINEGEKPGLLGINGTGKSTLLKILAGLEEPDEGSVARRRNLYIRYLPQIPEFKEVDTVLESIMRDNEKESHYSSRDEMQVEAKSMLNELGITDHDAKMETLSGGQRKRVALASVLMSRAELLILDEPTAGLDPKGRDSLLAVLTELHKKLSMTVILVSHSMEDVARVAKHVIVMNDGAVYMNGTVSEVFKRGDELVNIGLNVPEITRLIAKLNEMGASLPKDIYTVKYAAQLLGGAMKGKSNA